MHPETAERTRGRRNGQLNGCDKGRPGLYVWVVKRWLKGEGGGLLAVARGIVKGQSGDGDLTAEVEVRFEWKRGKAKRKREHREREKEGEEEGAERASRRQPSTANLGSAPAKRLSISVISRQSSFSTTAASEDGHAVDADGRRQSIVHADEDSGDESDPEDSETPWTCTVKDRERGQQEREAQDKAQWKQEVLRTKVGTLSPTPHHPKVVATLKAPFPLQDIDVEHMDARKREGGNGFFGSTGLWLVVREGFGGVGKVARKGDGWRIRG
ncbi:hypothetical protein DFH09DRAFT_1326443 [Mycena vulgaris]|nr:hypothetical protein DFH09DRAFT_1326443 [Mycena vulgaris]